MTVERLTLLLVERDPREAHRLVAMLEAPDSVGFEISQAEGVPKALDRCGEKGVDAILLDIVSCDGNGLQAFRALQSKAPGAAIVILTGEKDEELAIQAVKEGAQDFLVRGQNDEKLLARSLQNAIRRKRDSQVREEFVSDASHEMRSPLAVLKVAICNLRRSMADTADAGQERMLHIAEANVDRLATFIGDLLDLSRLERGKATLDRRSVNLLALIHETVRSLELPAKNLRIQLEAEIAGDLPAVCADEHMMERVIAILLNNALQRARRKVRISAASANGDGVWISVIDDGEAIPEEKIDSLFEKTSRLRDAEEHEGSRRSGLELAICREIITRHDGEINVERGLSRGARFHLIIPRQHEAAS